MDKLARQRQIESDSVRDGCVRWCQNTEYLEAADTKPYRKLIGISLGSLADAIRAEQDSLKTSKKAKLPAWGLALLSLGHEQLALITLGTLFNMIARSEFDTCLPPRITPVAYDRSMKRIQKRLGAGLRAGSMPWSNNTCADASLRLLPFDRVAASVHREVRKFVGFFIVFAADVLN
jgi:hypothetical protein